MEAKDAKNILKANYLCSKVGFFKDALQAAITSLEREQEAKGMLPEEKDIAASYIHPTAKLRQQDYDDGYNKALSDCLPAFQKLLGEKEKYKEDAAHKEMDHFCLKQKNAELKNVAKSASNISEKQMYEIAELKAFIEKYFSKVEGVRYSKIIALEKENDRLKAQCKKVSVEEIEYLINNNVIPLTIRGKDEGYVNVSNLARAIHKLMEAK